MGAPKPAARSGAATSKPSEGSAAGASGGNVARRGAASGGKAAARPPAKARRGAATQGATLDLAPYLDRLGINPNTWQPGIPVRVLLLEADRLRKAAQAQVASLKKLPGFAAEHLRDLPALIQRLAEAEKAWGRARFAKTQSSRGALRKEAEALRSAIMVAGRYLLRRDEAAQAELARIAEGEGLADLVQDLDDLADFVEAHAETFALDRRLPKKTPERARRLAAELREVDPGDGGAMRDRNLAAAALDHVLDEVRAAARYLFADEPRQLAPFLSRYEALRSRRARARRKARSQGTTPALTAEEA